MRSERCDDPFLIIAGVIKSGTTSVFQYLAAHPGVCRSYPEEPYYFLPAELPPESAFRHGRDPLADYLSVFRNHQPGQIRLEGSTIYLPVPGVAEVIKEVLPNARIIVLLRDPISRLISYHKMVTLFRWLPSKQTFDEYINEVRRIRDANELERMDLSPHYTNPIEEGRYAQRVRHWLEVFGADRVAVVWFDDLRSAPLSVMIRICELAGLDPRFYDNFSFVNVNPARRLRSDYAADAYSTLKRFLNTRLAKESRARRLLAAINRKLEFGLVWKMLTRPAPAESPHPDTLDFLRKFYADDVAALAQVLKCPPPWASRYLGS